MPPPDPNAPAAPAIAIIPARMASVRFPGKPLAAETGRPLIAHVCDAAARARLVSRVVVATDEPRIADAARDAGAEAVLTRADHPNGTARLAEAADLLALADDAVVVNVQGDEPEIDPGVIDAAIEKLIAGGVDVSTIASPITDEAEAGDPNVVKVVVDRGGRALYFSRARIPHERDPEAGRRGEGPGIPGGGVALRHVGLYCYTARFLRVYAGLPETGLERVERLEQLRVLEHGRSIGVAIRQTGHTGIDTPEQYAAFVRRFASGASS